MKYQNWNKKLDDSKLRADKKEELINKLLKENETLLNDNTNMDDKIKDLEQQLLQITKEKESWEKLADSLSLQHRNSNKENEPMDILKKDLDWKKEEIIRLQCDFKQERLELKRKVDDFQIKNQKTLTELEDLKQKYELLKQDYDKIIVDNSSLKDKIVDLTNENEEEQRKIENKYKREVEILHEKLYIKDNQIIELQKMITEAKSESNTKVFTRPGDDISKISEKIRAEYIGAIETMQTNLENLKLKYQKEVAARKDESIVYKEEVNHLSRKIKILEGEIDMINKNSTDDKITKDYKEEALEEKSRRIELEEEKDLLQTVLASTKAAWAQWEMDKEEIHMKYKKKKEEVNLYGERIAELELQVVRGKQDLVDAMNSMQKYDNLI